MCVCVCVYKGEVRVHGVLQELLVQEQPQQTREDETFEAGGQRHFNKQ